MTSVPYLPQGRTLEQFHLSDAFGRVVIGPLGSGKTFACIVEVLRQIGLQAPDNNGVRRSRVAVVRNTSPDLHTTTINDFKEVLDRIDQAGDWRHSAPTTWNTNYNLPDGSTVEAELLFLAFDDPGDQKKARGLQLSGVYFNELKELNEANVNALLDRVDRFPPLDTCPDRRSFFVADSNAPDRDHWLARWCFDTDTPHYEFFRQPPGVLHRNGQWIANPQAENLRHLSPDYYTKKLAGKKDSYIRQNYANEFVHHIDGRAVHPSFNEATHVAEVPLDPMLGLTVGIDFGRTPAATIGQRQHDGRWFILDELTTENVSALKFGEILAEHMHRDEYRGLPVEYIGDPAGMQMAQTRDETAFQMLRVAGVTARPCPGNNDFEQRTTALDVLLEKLIAGKPAIQIHPRCKTLTRGLAGEYCFKRIQVKNDDRYQDKPDKGPTSHVCESLHYLLLGATGGVLMAARKATDPRREEWQRRRRTEERQRAFE